MDNNVLRSPRFNDIIDDIISVGFGKGATYKNPRTGKESLRFVDFNQGLDALFLTEEKAKRFSEIALSPARVAFDHIEDKDLYERALRLCAKNGITELSNYVLYNSEDFGGKGRKYSADTPKDLYDRMKITLDLKDKLNEEIGKENVIAAFSFPMRYIPLNAHERGYVGTNWNAKFLRAVQRMLVPTQGKGVCSREFFEADFGKSSEEFVRFLCMPEKLIASRGKISSKSRGKSKETREEFYIRKTLWERDQLKIKKWNDLYDQLGMEKETFVSIIGDNVYVPEKIFTINSEVMKKLYLLYLTIPRLLSLFGMISKDSRTYDLIKTFILEECPEIYEDILWDLGSKTVQQKYLFRNFVLFFGRKGVIDLINSINFDSLSIDKQLAKWHEICQKEGFDYIDFELLRVYARFIEMNILSTRDREQAKVYINALDNIKLASLLEKNIQSFKNVLYSSLDSEMGKRILKDVTKTIISNIQLKLIGFSGEENG